MPKIILKKVFNHKITYFVLLLLMLAGILTISLVKSKVRVNPMVKPQSEAVSGNYQDKKNDIEIIADNLDIPWEVAFLPGKDGKSTGDILVTERPGTLLLLKNKQKIPIEGVAPIGEGGLLGLALDPEFSLNNWIYLYLTTKENGKHGNKVIRYTLEGDKLSESQTIIQGIDASSNHDGGRIAFGPDGYLYITTGDAETKNNSQNTSSLNGKILRIKSDGSIPQDNPFNNPVYSFGHRNPQGLAWDEKGQLWSTEHGRSGLQSGLDELNLIEKGTNYGWPVIQGDETKKGMARAVINSGASVTWAPSGAAYLNGYIFFSGLRGESLYRYSLVDGSLSEFFKNEFGRLRAVVAGPDGYLYITTSNRDGRGKPDKDDDKLIKINPESLTYENN